jgi:D-alanyl-D-alanine carboxypeptidase/D-alanyl-D-alanine-endopeptidase (penicillin-binding protein 4)
MLHHLAAIVSLAAPAIPQDPATALAKLAGAPVFAGAHVGVQVVDLADGSEVCARNADYAFVPASNQKLISTYAALHQLGSGFRFRTELRARGWISGDVLHGDLVLVGAGDPTFGDGSEPGGPTAPFERFAAKLIERGVRRVTGRVVADDDCQPDLPLGEGWFWDDQSEPFSAQLGGVCFARNVVKLELTAGDDAIDCRLTPDTRYVQVVAKPSLVDAQQWLTELVATRAPATNRIEVTGKLRRDGRPYSTYATVENPTLYAATVLRETLQRAGIEIGGAAVDGDDGRPDPTSPSETLAIHDSAPLVQIIARTNQPSWNLAAEQLLLAATRQTRGEATYEQARTMVRLLFEELRIERDGMRLTDGSGLSRLNQVRPAQLTALLAAIWQGPLRDAFVQSLPLAGVEGTLENRMTAGVAHARVRAKTGTMRGIAALSGYLPRPDPAAAPLAFSILVNGIADDPSPIGSTREARLAIDAFVEQLAAHLRWK